MKKYFEQSDMLNDEGLDEMQKTYVYQLAFKCFKFLYWGNMAFAIIPMFFPSVTNKSSFFAIIFLWMMLITNIIYVDFGIKASKVGALNPTFNQYITKPSTIISFIVMFIFYTIFIILKHSEVGIILCIYFEIYIGVMVVSHIALGYIVKKNNKIIENESEE